MINDKRMKEALIECSVETLETQLRDMGAGIFETSTFIKAAKELRDAVENLKGNRGTRM